MTYVSDNRAWLEPYVRQLQSALHLDYWKITLEDEWPDHLESDHAAGLLDSTYQLAKLYLKDPGGDMELLRRNIVHELLHLVARDQYEACQAARDFLMPAPWNVIHEWMDREHEQMIDHIAWAWAATLPLPKPSKRKG